MKNLLLTCLLAFTALASQAQIADYSYAANLVDSTYPDRQAYDLHAVLDSGYTVIVDVMATWCGPCWSWHEGEYFKQLDALYGPNGTNELRVLMVEADSRTPEDLLSRQASGGTAATTSLGDWTDGIKYAIVDNDQFATDYEIAYFPTIYAISPNRMVYEIGRHTDLTVYQNYAQNALGTAVDGPNAAALGYTGAKDACGIDAPTSALIQNLSTQPASGIVVRLVDQTGATVVENTSADLDPYEIANVNIGDIPASAFDNGSVNLTLQVEVAGDLRDTDNSVEGIIVGSPVATADSLVLEFTTDFWCAETGLRVLDGDNNVILNKRFTGDANNGGGVDANKTFTFDIPVENTDPACWTFNVTDDYGDGADQYPPGAPIPGMRLLTLDGDVLFARNFVEDNFVTATRQSAKLNSIGSSGVQTPVASQISVYPNPAAAGNMVVVELAGLTSTGDINARLINAVGQTVHTYNASAANQMLTFELPQGLSGMYFLELSSTAGTSIQRLTVK